MESILLSITIGYLFGSMPIAYLIARCRGVNIFEIGTRNPGAANVFRTISRPLGILVLVLDVLKGILAVAVVNIIMVVMPETAVAAGAAAVVGHWHPVFLKFKGGAGLATAIGAGVGLAPTAMILALLLGLLTLPLIRSSGHVAAVGYVCFLGLSIFLDTSWTAILGVTLLIIMVKVRSVLVSEQ